MDIYFLREAKYELSQLKNFDLAYFLEEYKSPNTEYYKLAPSLRPWVTCLWPGLVSVTQNESQF